MEVYNLSYNQYNNQTLEKMIDSSLYDFFFKQMQESPNKYLLSIILLIVPGLNVLIWLCALMCAIIYHIALNVYKRNLLKVSDPLINMIYAPELCFE